METLIKLFMDPLVLGYSLIALAAFGVKWWFKTPSGKKWLDGK